MRAIADDDMTLLNSKVLKSAGIVYAFACSALSIRLYVHV
jgi:hypothetical protein